MRLHNDTSEVASGSLDQGVYSVWPRAVGGAGGAVGAVGTGGSWGVRGVTGGECPFVDRADARCSVHLTMGGIGYAFDHCFDDFAACPVHAELALEGRGEGAEGRSAVGGGGEDADRSRVVEVEIAADVGRWERIKSRLVELTVGRRRITSPQVRRDSAAA